jgi:hypothetical protein
MTAATIAKVHEFFCDGFVVEEGKKVPVNGYTLTNFRADWSALSTEEKEWFKNEVGAAIGA